MMCRITAEGLAKSVMYNIIQYSTLIFASGNIGYQQTNSIESAIFMVAFARGNVINNEFLNISFHS